MHTLFVKYWSKTNYSKVDIDAHNYPESFWNTLSTLTGESIARLYMMRLNQYEGYIDEDVSHNGKCNWIVPGGHRDKVKNKFYNLRYCPECLREATYFKLEWRLLYITICTKHKIYLNVDCPQCHQNIKLKHVNVFQNIDQCNCNYYLREAPKKKVKQKDLKTLNKLNNIATQGYIIINGKEEHSIGFFFIYRIITSKILKLRKSKISHLEELTPIELASLLTQAIDIFDNWPNNLIHFCKENKLSNKNKLLDGNRNSKDVPFWFIEGIEPIMKGSYRKSEEEVDFMFKYLYKDRKPTLHEIQEVSGWNLSYGSEMRVKWLKKCSNEDPRD